MDGTHFKRRIAAALLSVLSAVVLTAAILPGPSTAFEEDGGCRATPNPVYNNGPNGPLTFYVGDSISNLAKDYYAYVNGVRGWKTRVLATGASNIKLHRCLNWLSFYWAHESSARAVVVELGTNDISGINESLSQSRALQEFYKVFVQMDWVSNYLSNKCVIWIGQNERFDTYVTVGGRRIKFTDKDAAIAFDNKLKELVANHPNLHWADYSAFIRDNDVYRRSLTDGDGIHPSTAAGLRELAAWVSRRIDNNCI